ncbi:MAG: response regulator, partial [Candidatus Thiodiazotropha sp.]
MSPPGSVIFIDDEKHIRIANTQTLELAGLVVQALERAELALPMLSHDWPGVVVCDIKMPGMDGMSFLRKAL